MAQKIAFVFPGQGSQSIGMTNTVYETYPIVRDLYQQAEAVLGYDLWEITQSGPQERLNQTEITQPALLTASYATWCVWQQLGGIKPDYLAGHSLGEYTALVCAESLTFSDGLLLVAERGRLMQQAVPQGVGAMAAIVGLSQPEVIKVCKEAALEQTLSPANFNSPEQTVISGDSAAVLRAIELAKARGAKIAKLLDVSVPSHCALMQTAANALAVTLEKIALNMPKIPVVHNVNAQMAQNTQALRAALLQQLVASVHWVDTITYFANQEVTAIYECGPGKVLTGLLRRMAPTIQGIALINADIIQTQVSGPR